MTSILNTRISICTVYAATTLLCCGQFTDSAAAITTSLGQTWNYQPDAWTRGNDADTAWFGWDVLERDNDALGPFFLRILDDRAPDVGIPTTATNTRLYQGADGADDTTGTASGHVTSTNNYYSAIDTVNDTITASAPASGSGGHTTVVLQIIGQPGSPISDLMFDMDDSSAPWTLQKQLYGTNGQGSGLHWVEWTAPGDNLTFNIRLSSFAPHQAIDAFQMDTYWTAGASPALTSIQRIPEPAAVMLTALGVCGGLLFVGGRKRAVERG